MDEGEGRATTTSFESRAVKAPDKLHDRGPRRVETLTRKHREAGLKEGGVAVRVNALQELRHLALQPGHRDEDRRRSQLELDRRLKAGSQALRPGTRGRSRHAVRCTAGWPLV